MTTTNLKELRDNLCKTSEYKNKDKIAHNAYANGILDAFNGIEKLQAEPVEVEKR